MVCVFRDLWGYRDRNSRCPLGGSGGTGRRAGLKNRCPWYDVRVRLPPPPQRINMAYSSPEIDLHGLTLDEALSKVESELNHAFIQEDGDRRLKFVTGWGSRLRPEVRNYLLDHPLVRELSMYGPIISVDLEEL